MRKRFADLAVADIETVVGHVLDVGRVNALAESFVREGQIQPIVVTRSKKGAWVESGAHRLAAAKQLGWVTIEAMVKPPEPSDAAHRAKVIAENLVRLHMTPEQKNKSLAALVALREVEKPSGERKMAQKKPNENARAQVAREKRGAHTLTPRSEAIRQVAAETGKTPGAIRDAVRRAEPKAPAPVAVQCLDERGQAVPAGLVARWELHRAAVARIGELSRQISIEIGGAAADGRAERWTQVKADYRRALGAAKAMVPFAVCAWCKGAATGCKSCGGFGLQTEIEQHDTPRELFG